MLKWKIYTHLMITWFAIANAPFLLYVAYETEYYLTDIQLANIQFDQVCSCFGLLSWPSYCSWMITLATFLKDYFNFRAVKYLVDLFLYTLPEKIIPIKKCHVLGSGFDGEELAQHVFSNFFKVECSFLHFWDWNATVIPTEVTILCSTAQPNWIPSRPDVLHVPSVWSFLFIALIGEMKK